MKKTIFAGLALVALIQPAAAQEPAATYIHAGRLLADPASGRVEPRPGCSTAGSGAGNASGVWRDTRLRKISRST